MEEFIWIKFCFLHEFKTNHLLTKANKNKVFHSFHFRTSSKMNLFNQKGEGEINLKKKCSQMGVSFSLYSFFALSFRHSTSFFLLFAVYRIWPNRKKPIYASHMWWRKVRRRRIFVACLYNNVTDGKEAIEMTCASGRKTITKQEK